MGRAIGWVALTVALLLPTANAGGRLAQVALLRRDLISSKGS
jgi:hypothetical protein